MKELLTALRHAAQELAHHKLRTSLTLLGMIFGVGAVIAMLSIGEGAQREALKLVEGMGLRNLIVQAREFDDAQLKENRERSVGLSLLDVSAALDTLPQVEGHASEKTIKSYALFSHFGRSDARVIAVSPQWFALASLAARDGRLLTAEDETAFAQIAVLGSQAASSLFPRGGAVGGLVKVDHLWLRVVGVLDERQLGQAEFEGVKLGSESNQVFLPLATAHKRLKFPTFADEIDAFRLRLAPEADPGTVAASLSHLLSRRHGGVDDFEVVIPARLLHQHQQTQRIFTIVMACVAGISLLVGGIGIMNIMLATVMERRAEIGLLRALGARQKDVVRQFLVEAGLISLLGALLGIALGIALAYAIAAFAGWQVAWSAYSILLAVGVCMAIGLGFGVYPARTAARLDPITALQSA